jgi:hypothetical protein
MGVLGRYGSNDQLSLPPDQLMVRVAGVVVVSVETVKAQLLPSLVVNEPSIRTESRVFVPPASSENEAMT